MAKVQKSGVIKRRKESLHIRCDPIQALKEGVSLVWAMMLSLRYVDCDVHGGLQIVLGTCVYQKIAQPVEVGKRIVC